MQALRLCMDIRNVTVSLEVLWTGGVSEYQQSSMIRRRVANDLLLRSLGDQ